MKKAPQLASQLLFSMRGDWRKINIFRKLGWIRVNEEDPLIITLVPPTHNINANTNSDER